MHSILLTREEQVFLRRVNGIVSYGWVEAGAGIDNQMGEVERRERRYGMHKETTKIKGHLMEVCKPSTVEAS